MIWLRRMGIPCIAFVLSACGNSDGNDTAEENDGPPDGMVYIQCVFGTVSEPLTCSRYVEEENDTGAITQYRDICTNGGGTLVSRCPTANVSATCSTLELTLFYYGALSDPARLEMMCTSLGGGVWETGSP